MATEKYNLITYEPNSTDEFGNLIINVMSGSNSNMTKIDAALGDKPDKVVPATNGSIAILDAEGNLVDSEKTVDKIQPSTNEIMADISINDGDYVPFYDTGTSVHKKSLWSNIIAKIRAALFDTSNGLLKANGSGIISAATAGIDYAEANHIHPVSEKEVVTDTSAQFYNNNPVLSNGQMAYETDTQCFKIGDGITVWRNLKYTYVPTRFETRPPVDGADTGIPYQRWVDTIEKKEYVYMYDGISEYGWADLIYYITTHSHSPASIGAVPTTRTVNGKALSSDISLSASDVSAIPTSGGTLSGALSGAAGTDYTTARFRNITLSTSSPSDGNNGDIWIKYTP